MTRFFLLVMLCFLTTSFSAQATTWDEPWQEQVVQDADCFVLARIQACDRKQGATLHILKKLAGSDLTEEVSLDSFSLLHLCSRSGNEGPEFRFDVGDTTYFFLKQTKPGHYSIATPTTGYARREMGKVSATYRHSYHQALVPAAVYEPTMIAIFQRYHRQAYNSAFINSFVDEYLNRKPAALNEEEIDTFFLQHVALETVYHLQLSDKYALLLPFLHDTKNFHAQTSATRALVAYNTPEAKQQLLTLLTDKSTSLFIKAVVVKTLDSYRPVELKSKLQQLVKGASQEDISFGGNIMDPRVCTHLPTIKESLEQLIANL